MLNVMKQSGIWFALLFSNMVLEMLTQQLDNLGRGGKAMKKTMILTTMAVALVGLMVLGSPGPASADTIVFWNPSNPTVVGLNAEAIFHQVDATHIDITLINISTAQPTILNDNYTASQNSANQLLVGLGFDLGVAITGGSAFIASSPSSTGLFDTGTYGAGTNVSVEWGFANNVTFTAVNFAPGCPTGGCTVTMADYLSTISAQTTVFQAVNGSHPNLDGPSSLNGPQPGMATNPPLYALGGVGATETATLYHLILSGPVDLTNFDPSTVRFEFGSALIFGKPSTPVPEPASLLLLGSGLAGLVLWRRRKQD